MNTDASTALKITRVVKSDAASTFRAWTEPDQLLQWSAPEGATVEVAEVNLTVGGRYHIRMKTDEGEYNAVGVYREIESSKRLVYTWNWEEEENDVGETLVTVEFNELGESTEIIVTHELFPNAEAKSSHEEGWGSCLNRLQKLLS
jgi:uncharacterized protein YndB with AHSA1/START domain